MEVTKAHRLAVARAWDGHPDVDGFRLETRRWAQTGLVDDADSAGLERLAKLVADAEGAWIPCEERMPIDGALVLISDGEGVFRGCPWIDGFGQKGWLIGERFAGGKSFTHWRPLPNPPEQP